MLISNGEVRSLAGIDAIRRLHRRILVGLEALGISPEARYALGYPGGVAGRRGVIEALAIARFVSADDP
jgi:hypothetical protein